MSTMLSIFVKRYGLKTLKKWKSLTRKDKGNIIIMAVSICKSTFFIQEYNNVQWKLKLELVRKFKI